jgi:hypothetical protein
MGNVDDEGYDDRLRTNIADPERAQVAQCPDCGARVAYRCWPTDTFEPTPTLDAFLDGLTVLDAMADWTVYGGWMLTDGPVDGSTRAQLWSGRERRLVTTGTMATVVREMMVHICAPLGQP